MCVAMLCNRPCCWISPEINREKETTVGSRVQTSVKYYDDERKEIR